MSISIHATVLLERREPGSHTRNSSMVGDFCSTKDLFSTIYHLVIHKDLWVHTLTPNLALGVASLFCQSPC